MEAAPAIEHVISGYNCTIFAYGQTGAGKTHTMEGNKTDPGIIPRLTRALLGRLNEQGASAGVEWTLQMSYLEIYNEKVNDLLDLKQQDLPVREDLNRNIFVGGLSQKQIHNFAEFQHQYEAACSSRKQASTALNAKSSRSHAVLSLSVRIKTSTALSMGKLHLIDLAGSEDNRQTTNTGQRMVESASINQSLFVLGQVVDALRAGGQKRVPYRDSKLTRFLQDSLGGTAFGIVIANVAPNGARETFRTLSFASKSRDVVSCPVQHTVALPPPLPPLQFRSLKGSGGSTAAAASSSSSSVHSLQAATRVANAASILRHDTTQLARKLAAAAAPTGAYAAAAPKRSAFAPLATSSASDTLLTPLTRARATEQVIARAQQWELTGDYDRALSIYQGALALVGDDAEIAERIAALRSKLEAPTNMVPIQDDPERLSTTPLKARGGTAGAKKVTKKREKENDEENGANDEGDDEDFLPEETKPQKKAKAKKGSKIKDPLENLVVPENVTAKLLEMLNTASVAELTTLQSIGKKRAEQIVEHRTSVARFECIQELGKVGFGAKMIDTFLRRNIHVGE